MGGFVYIYIYRWTHVDKIMVEPWEVLDFNLNAVSSVSYSIAIKSVSDSEEHPGGLWHVLMQQDQGKQLSFQEDVDGLPWLPWLPLTAWGTMACNSTFGATSWMPQLKDWRNLAHLDNRYTHGIPWAYGIPWVYIFHIRAFVQSSFQELWFKQVFKISGYFSITLIYFAFWIFMDFPAMSRQESKQSIAAAHPRRPPRAIALTADVAGNLKNQCCSCYGVFHGWLYITDPMESGFQARFCKKFVAVHCSYIFLIILWFYEISSTMFNWDLSRCVLQMLRAGLVCHA